MDKVDILEEVKALEIALSCFTCKNTLDDPYVVGKCGHTVCKKCFFEEFDLKCPICNISVNSKDSQEDTQLKSLLSLTNQLKALIQDESSILNKNKAPINHDQNKTERILDTRENISLPLGKKISSTNTKEPKHKNSTVSQLSPLVKVDRMVVHETPQNRIFSTPQNKTKVVASQSSKKKVYQSIKNLNVSVRSSPGNLGKRNAKGETPLHVAVIKGDKVKVMEYLQQGSNPNVKDHCGWTPLHEASNHGYLEIAEMLLNHGAFVNVPGDQNITPLHDALMNNQLQLAKMLASRGGDVHARTSLGNTALDLCQNDEDRKSLIDACPVHISPSIVLPTPKLPDTENKIVFLPTSLSDSQKAVLKKCAEMLKADVVDDYTKDVTHIIAACDEIGLCTRTLKLLMGVLAGKWIMNYKWIELCLEYKLKVDEEVYEVPGIKNQPNIQGPKRARENFIQQLPPLFDGCYFYLHGHFTKPTPEREDLINLIHQGGGKILTREPRHDTVNNNMYMIPYHASGTTLEDINHFILYQDRPPRGTSIRSNHICSVHVLWLVECISGFKLLDPDIIIIPK